MIKGKRSNKDSFRKPEKLLEFAGLQPHHKVLDVCTGFGYLARHISLISKRRVDAQNMSEWRTFYDSIGIQSVVDDMEQKYNIGHAFSSMEDPALGQVGRYDLITMQNGFHTLYELPIDRRKFFRSIRRALKPGGKFLIVDHRVGLGQGTGPRDAESDSFVHRIEEGVARQELMNNGFVITKSSDMFRRRTGSSDDSNDYPMRESNRFVILCEEATPI